MMYIREIERQINIERMLFGGFQKKVFRRLLYVLYRCLIFHF